MDVFEGSKAEEDMVDHWRENTVLYDTSIKGLNVKDEKEKALAEIAADLEMSLKELNRKMCSLRTAYGRMLRADRRLRRSGSRYQPTTARQAWIYRALSFLERFMTHAATEESANLDTADDSEPATQEGQISQSQTAQGSESAYDIHTMSTSELVRYSTAQQKFLTAQTQSQSTLDLSGDDTPKPSQDGEKLSAKRRRQRRAEALKKVNEQIQNDGKVVDDTQRKPSKKKKKTRAPSPSDSTSSDNSEIPDTQLRGTLPLTPPDDNVPDKSTIFKPKRSKQKKGEGTTGKAGKDTQSNQENVDPTPPKADKSRPGDKRKAKRPSAALGSSDQSRASVPQGNKKRRQAGNTQPPPDNDEEEEDSGNEPHAGGRTWNNQQRALYRQIRTRQHSSRGVGKAAVNRAQAGMYESVSHTLDAHRDEITHMSENQIFCRYLCKGLDRIKNARVADITRSSMDLRLLHAKLGYYNKLAGIPANPTFKDLPSAPTVNLDPAYTNQPEDNPIQPSRPSPPTVNLSQSETTVKRRRVSAFKAHNIQGPPGAYNQSASRVSFNVQDPTENVSDDETDDAPDDDEQSPEL